MGKNLIIKGADFSENAVLKKVLKLAIDSNEYIALAATEVNSKYIPYADNRYANLYGKHLAGVEFKACQAGNISIVSYKNSTLTTIATLQVTQEMIGTKVFFELDYDVANGEIIGILNDGDTGNFYYYSVNVGIGFIRYLGKNNQEQVFTRCLCVNWYILDYNE